MFSFFCFVGFFFLGGGGVRVVRDIKGKFYTLWLSMNDLLF